MEAKANYTLVGLTVLILLTSMLSAALWLSTGFDNKKYNNYLVYMQEPISGLNNESAVKYNGVRVGYVGAIDLNPNNPKLIKLTLKIVEGTPITIHTTASLVSQGITGATYLGLTADSSDNTPLTQTPGEPYPVIIYKPSFFYQLEKNINKIGKQLTEILSEQNAENLKETLTNLEKVSKILADNENNINQTLKDLPILVRNFTNSVRHFTHMADSLYTAGHQVTDTMKSGRRSIDQISQQTLPNLSDLFQKMNRVALNLEALSSEMKRNPAILIRGTTPPKPGPGESK